jgi:hypothetical protein
MTSTKHNSLLPPLGLEEKLILEGKVILEDGPSGLIISDLTQPPTHPTPTPSDMDCQIIANL